MPLLPIINGSIHAGPSISIPVFVCIHFIHVKILIHADPAAAVYISLHIKGILFIIVRQHPVPPVLGYVKLIAEKRPHAPQLQDALVPIHDRELIPAHQFIATLSSGEFKIFLKVCY